MNLYEFPYDKVAYASHVIIYGAGEVGQTYLDQILKTKYCSLECILDRDFMKYNMLPVEVCDPSAILNKKYDAIVIANNSKEIASEIRRYLIDEYGVPEEKIIYENKFVEPVAVIREDGLSIDENSLACNKAGKYPVAINLTGGFGDYIIRKENIKEISSWADDILIDIYVGEGKGKYAETLFSDIKNINLVIGSNIRYERNKKKYTAAVHLSTFLVVDFLDETALDNLPAKLKFNLKTIQDEYCKYGLKEFGVAFSLHYARCRKDGLNCYTAYNRYGVFNVKDMRTTIPLLKEYEDEFNGLGISDYITLNYGWDRNLSTDKPPAKVWPFEYYEDLVKLLKEKYPKVSIVQLGMKDSPKIEGCDSYAFGKDIELVKFILRKSILHFDCEGGLVHLATQLGTKCVVFFGPTPVNYYGYESNINVVAGTCENCCWYVPDCFSCYRQLEHPECMYSILPQNIMQKISNEL